MDSAIAGLIGVIVGALLTGFIAWLNQRSQLAHDADQRSLERKHELRRSLFIESASGLQQAHRGLSALGKADPDLEVASNDFAEGLSKISLAAYVANEKTLETINSLTNEIGIVFLKTILSRKKIDDLKIDSDICKQAIDRCLAQQSQAVELMKEHNLSGNTDVEAFGRIQRYFDRTSTEIDELFAERDKLREMTNSAMSDFLRAIVPLREKLIPLSVKTTATIRSELGFPSNEAEMLRLSAATQSQAAAALDTFLADLYREAEN